MSTISERLISITRRAGGKTDRGALANLRRGFSIATRHYAWPELARMGFQIADESDPPLQRIAFESALWTAALYAEHPHHSTDPKENIGATWLRIYRRRKPRGGDDKDSYQMRFHRLISCDREELPDHLLAVVRLAATEGFAVNYDLLYKDLRYWGELTKLRWAKQFHAVKEAEEDEEGQ